MSRFQIRKAIQSDSESLLKLMSSTHQEGKVRVNFERKPNFFYGSLVTAPNLDILVAEDRINKHIIGVYSIGSRNVFVNGQMRRVKYGCDLRIHRDYRRGSLLARLTKEVRKSLGENWAQAVILSENVNVFDIPLSGGIGRPKFFEWGAIKTHLIYIGLPKSRPRGNYNVRVASENDIDIMQDFFNKEAPKKQFYPYYQFSRISEGRDPYYRDQKIEDYFLCFEGDHLVGVTGFWNQKDFKQTRFVGYPTVLKALRPLYNLQSRLTGGLELPIAGGLLNYGTLHSILVKDNQPIIFSHLFHKIYSSFRGTAIKAIVCGLSSNDPLMTVFKSYRKQTMGSKHYIFSFGDDPRKTLDPDRILYVEIARL